MSPPSKFPRRSVDVATTHSNTSLEIVEITTDKLVNILSEHLKKSEKANEWQAALGVLLATVGALVTTEFKTTFGVEAGVWKAMFIIAAVASLVWLIKSVIRAIRVEPIGKLVSRIKNES
jgi:hypothetical protein